MYRYTSYLDQDISSMKDIFQKIVLLKYPWNMNGASMLTLSYSYHCVWQLLFSSALVGFGTGFDLNKFSIFLLTLRSIL